MSQHTFTATYSITVTAPSRDMAASYARQMVEHGHDAIEARDAAGTVVLTAPQLGGTESADSAPDPYPWWCLIHGKEASEAEPEPWCRVCTPGGPPPVVRSEADAAGWDDAYEAGRDSILTATTLEDLAAIRQDADAAINGEVDELAALRRIRSAAARVADAVHAAVTR